MARLYTEENAMITHSFSLVYLYSHGLHGVSLLKEFPL
ncbi:MAG: hypothetical protein MAGBODY4_00201 [Candidatus Marinimicrobia bacterium]|nr:hypothetical protein [Candidatus Neomarinimicrobiota bacterium]